MRSLSEIHSEKEWVTTNLRKAGMWCGGGLAITILSLLIASHLGFSIITLGAIGWGGWNVYKCLKRLEELKEEERRVLEHGFTESYTPSSELTSSTKASPSPKPTATRLRSKTWDK
jgi:hypothetical protein